MPKKIATSRFVGGRAEHNGHTRWSGGLGKGGHGEAARAKVFVNREGRERFAGFFADKFAKKNENYPAERDKEILDKLKAAGCNVIPTYRIHIKVSKKSLLTTDLTEGGKKEVVPSERLSFGTRLKNFPEVIGQMISDIEKAANAGIFLHRDCWLIQIDPKTRKGKAFIVDVASAREIEKGEPLTAKQHGASTISFFNALLEEYEARKKGKSGFLKAMAAFGLKK